MTQLTFKTLTFKLEGEFLTVKLLNMFSTKIPLEELDEVKIIDDYTIEINEKRFNLLLLKYFDNLVNTFNGNKATYIHKNTGIPLLGNVSFGIIYRNSSLIEIKPQTSCNLNCIYCSISEGLSSTKNDFVVEKDYLVEELEKLIKFVDEPVEIHIGVQGEPMLYADLLPLIADLQKNKQITLISMDTNFTLATRTFLDKIIPYDKVRFNISLNALEPELAEKIAGSPYNLKYVLEMIRYAVKKKIKILIAPVYVPGYNDGELEKIIRFVKELGLKETAHPLIGIQNFLNYKTGRNPVRSVGWDKYKEMLKNLEKKTGMKLLLSEKDFGIQKTKLLGKPFKVGEVVSAVIKCPDRFAKSVVAVAKNRTISVPNCDYKKEKKIKVRITRDKHNIFVGKIIN